MSVRMRHTKGHTNNRRSHHKVGEPRLSACSNCQAPHLRHRACLECGKYKGREVIDVTKKSLKENKDKKETIKEEK